MRKVYFKIQSKRRDFAYIFYLVGGTNSPFPLPHKITAISDKIWLENMLTQEVAMIKTRGLDDLFSSEEFAFVKLSAIFAAHTDVYELTGYEVS